MIKNYKDLDEAEERRLAHVWSELVYWLKEYEEVTGAHDLDEVLYEKLWDEIDNQKEEEL
jgi:hypothetical protein